MIARFLLALIVSMYPVFAFALEASPAGLQQNVVFSEYTPLSTNLEVMRRSLSPLAFAQATQILALSGKALSEQSIDLFKERFTLYVPSAAPPNGYALLVFVPPWQDAKLPQDWEPVLDRHGIIYVSAAGSGNDESVLGRREPLALIAVQNVLQRYSIDPNYVFVAGFSGGARVAMRLALSYPDVFHGALLIAGSDQIGDTKIPLPPENLFSLFEKSTRLIYLTGEEDVVHLGMAAVSLRSMHDWCMFNVDTEITPQEGHEVSGPTALSGALKSLLETAQPDSEELVRCRSVIEADVAAKLQQVQSLIGEANIAEAQKLLNSIDQHYGGLAAPRSLELESELRNNAR